jgi:hypothetical protein
MPSSELADDAGSQDIQVAPLSSQNPNYSPPRATRSSRKEQRPPSVTPRKFRKFFTPRSHGYQDSSSRQALQELTAPLLNRNVTQSSPLRPFKSVNSKEDSPTSFIRGSKRQKTTHTPETSPRKSLRQKTYSFPEANEGEHDEHLLSSPCERAVPDASEIEREPVEEHQYQEPKEPTKRIVSRVNKSLGGQLLDLSIRSSLGRRSQNHIYPVNGLSRHHCLLVSC